MQTILQLCGIKNFAKAYRAIAFGRNESWIKWRREWCGIELSS